MQSATFKVPGSGGQWPGYSLGVCRANQSHQARPEEAAEPSWATAKAVTVTLPLHLELGQRLPLVLELRGAAHSLEQLRACRLLYLTAHERGEERGHRDEFNLTQASSPRPRASSKHRLH